MNLFQNCFNKHYQNQNKAQTWPNILVPSIEGRIRGYPNLLETPHENKTRGFPST